MVGTVAVPGHMMPALMCPSSAIKPLWVPLLDAEAGAGAYRWPGGSHTLTQGQAGGMPSLAFHQDHTMWGPPPKNVQNPSKQDPQGRALLGHP